MANKAAKEATEKDILTLVSEKNVKLSKETPNYNKKDEKLIIKLQTNKIK